MSDPLMKNIRFTLTIVILTVAVATGVTAWLNSRTIPTYRSEARLLIVPNGAYFQGRDLLSGLETLERASVVATYEEVFNSVRIVRVAMADVGIDYARNETYAVETLALPSADVLQVVAEGTSAEGAAQLAAAVVNRGTSYLGERYPMYAIEQLDEPFPAEEPFAPTPRRDLLLAGGLGALFGLVLAALMNYSVRSESRERVPARHRRPQAWESAWEGRRTPSPMESDPGLQPWSSPPPRMR